MMFALGSITLYASFFALSNALYGSDDDVIELTETNFNSRVIDSDVIWVVEFFAPWCGHCQQLAPEYKKLARASKGLFKVGAVDATVHQSLASRYDVQGYPTIKIFGLNKDKPTSHSGQRTAQAMAESVISAIRITLNSRLGVSGGRPEGAGKKEGKGGKDVIELTDDNFEDLVLNSKDVWMVEFFAPWCGHCKALKPHWESAASQLVGKVKLGALDATVHQKMASKFGVKGFPTIKYFAPGSKASDAEDYGGGRTADDIVSYALDKAAVFAPAPEVLEVISQDVAEGACKDKQLCVVAVLPHILDCQSKCRNDYIKILKEMSEKFKRNTWGWLWTEAGKQPDLEEALGMGGFGYPAMAAVNYRKMKYSMLRGSFDATGINEFLRDLSYGKGQTVPLAGAKFPKVSKTEPWDGKDGEMPVEEDIDLSDIEEEEEPKKKKEEL